jgi:hypothetical protein
MKIELYLYQKYIEGLAATFEEVLDAWRVGESVEESKDLYEKAMALLPKHREETK